MTAVSSFEMLEINKAATKHNPEHKNPQIKIKIFIVMCFHDFVFVYVDRNNMHSQAYPRKTAILHTQTRLTMKPAWKSLQFSKTGNVFEILI
jgi:hypothetical protein